MQKNRERSRMRKPENLCNPWRACAARVTAEHIMEEHQERLNLEMTFEIMMERLKLVDLNFVCVFHGLCAHL